MACSWLLGHQPPATTLINTLPVIQYFVLAPSVLTFYFLVALSSFEVSHKLLGQDHCSTSLAASSQLSSPRGFEDNPPVTMRTSTSAGAPGIPSPLLAHHKWMLQLLWAPVTQPCSRYKASLAITSIPCEQTIHIVSTSVPPSLIFPLKTDDCKAKSAFLWEIPNYHLKVE